MNNPKKQNEIESEGVEIDRLSFVSQTSARCLSAYLASIGALYGSPDYAPSRARILAQLVDDAEALWDELCERFPVVGRECATCAYNHLTEKEAPCRTCHTYDDFPSWRPLQPVHYCAECAHGHLASDDEEPCRTCRESSDTPFWRQAPIKDEKDEK
jgi:hypothetical protein